MKGNISHGLHTRPSLNVSSTLTKAIELLSMTNIELDNHVSNYIENNPFIENMDGCGEKTILSDCDLGVAHNYYKSSEGSSFENFKPYEKTPYEIIEHEIKQILPIKDHKHGMRLFELMDSSGFISEPLPHYLEEIRERLCINTNYVGVFSKNIAQCIYLQLHSLDANMEFEKLKLISKKLLLDEKDHEKIKQIITSNKLKKYISHIDPSPLRSLGAYEKTISPDIFAEYNGNSWDIQVNLQNTPRIFINNGLYNELENSKSNNEYTKSKFNEAKWLIKSIEQRRVNTLKIAKILLEEQTGHILYNEPLSPLNGKEIAKKLNIHESTVSRVIMSKSILTNNGFFLLKSLLCSGISYIHDSDIKISRDFINNRIKKIISTEPKDKPLSDDAIAKRLCNEGIKIARRTVSKYRIELRISSAKLR